MCVCVHVRFYVYILMCVCVCVCARARARVCIMHAYICTCVCMYSGDEDGQEARGDAIERNGRKALEMTNMLVESGEIEDLRPVERVFATMPIRHFATGMK